MLAGVVDVVAACSSPKGEDDEEDEAESVDAMADDPVGSLPDRRCGTLAIKSRPLINGLFKVLKVAIEPRESALDSVELRLADEPEEEKCDSGTF